MPNHYTLWRDHHNKELKGLIRALWWGFPWIILVAVPIILFITLASFESLSRTLHYAQALELPAELLASHHRLAVSVAEQTWNTWVISLILLCIWIPVVNVAGSICMAVTDGILLIVSREPLAEAKHRSRCEAALRKAAYRVIWCGTIPVFLVFLYISPSYVATKPDIPDMVHYFARVLQFVAVVLPLLLWGHWLSIRFRRKRRRGLDWYLFSNTSIRRHFEGSIKILVLLALFGRVLLPGLFVSFQALGQSGAATLERYSHYREIRAELFVNGYEPVPSEVLPSLRFPEAERLPESLELLPDITAPQAASALVRQLQHEMFLAATLYLLIAIGFPSIVRSLLFGEYRKSVKTVLSATVKSVALVLALELILQKVFFIDLGSVFGVTAAFFFVVSYFLMQDSRTHDPA